MIYSRLAEIWYGGDYSPDQWPDQDWPRDLELFRQARINVVTLPVFSWANLQTDESTYDFDWLDRVLDLLGQHRLRACLATPTAAVPPWMAHQHPQVLRVDFHGRPLRFGFRRNFCPNSPVYREQAARLADRMAQRYHDHPALAAWHVNNEYGQYCYCDRCAAAFQQWLAQRYQTLDELNHRWTTAFWSHRFTAWEQIPPPNVLSEHFHPTRPDISAAPAISLDYHRFMSDSLLACFRLERDAIRSRSDAPITTNLMGTYKPLNYRQWAREMDVVSWDCYPGFGDDPADWAMRHALMRSLKRQPFLLMEQTPSQTNWSPYNTTKRPGEMRLQSYQALAHGADAVMFFQLKQSPGGAEKFHGAVIEHAGHPHTQTFRQVQTLGAELEALGDVIPGTRNHAKAAVMFDWEAWWALDLSGKPSQDLDYVQHVLKCYRALWRRHVAADIIGPGDSLEGYRLLIAPMIYLLRQAHAASLERFVEQGGVLLVTFNSGVVDETDRVVLGGYPGYLRQVCGVWVERREGLPPSYTNHIVIKEHNARYACGGVLEYLHAEAAQPVGTYASDFYQGSPALTCNHFGKGQAWYLGADAEPSLYDWLIGRLLDAAAVAGELDRPAPPGVEVVTRCAGDRVLRFVLNHNDQPVTLEDPKLIGTDLLSGSAVRQRLSLAPYGVAILQTSPAPPTSAQSSKLNGAAGTLSTGSGRVG